MRKTRSLVFLLPLMFVCACAVSGTDRGLTDPRAEALEALRDAAQFKHHAWTLSIANAGYHETSLWVSGNDLFAQVQIGGDDATQTELHAIDLRTGTHRWTLTLPAELDQPPSISPNRVALVCGSRAIIVNRHTGGRMSDGLFYELPSWPSARPALTDATLYVPTYIDNRLVTVDVNRGYTGWSYHTRGMLNAGPVVAGQGAKATLVVVTADGLVADLPALAAGEGGPRKENWTGHTYGANDLNPVASGDLVFVASDDGSVYAFNHLTGTIAWRYLCGENFRGEVAVGKDLVFVCTARDLIALDFASGSLKWQLSGLDRFVVRQGPRVIAHATDGSYRVLEAADGKELARFDSFLIKNVAVNQDGDLFVFGDGAGTFCALGAEKPAAAEAKKVEGEAPAEEKAEPAKEGATEEKGESPKEGAEKEEPKEEKPEGDSAKPADKDGGN
ncbi:MAG: PQQ-binding-like beta-propeller repeat protein [Planctomycetota bacterium]